MTWEALSFVMLGGLAFALVIGQWTAFALGTIGMLLLFLSRGEMGMLSVPSIVWNTANSYILIAVPMFLLMGEVILRAGIAGHFYRGVTVLMGRLPGGLLHANIVACALFSAISGSSVATAASVGTVAIPEMTKRRYEPRLIFGSLASGGTLGILIPPSIVMILYGALVEESIAKLFMAGLIPGILMSGLFMVYIAIRVLLDPSVAPQREALDMDARERRNAVLHILPIIVLLLVVLGGIYAGITTPTEAAAIGAAGAIVLAWFYGGLTAPVFRDALLSAVRTSCMVLFIIIGAQILSASLSFAGISRGLSGIIVDLEMSRWVLFAALVLLYVILGFFVDGVSMIYITLPVLYPVVIAAGFDPIWFGVVLVILIELGQITPPVGLNLFAIHGISGGYKFSDVVYGSAPFVGLMLLTLVLLAFVPGIALWLPSTM